MQEPREHWDRIYATRPSAEMSWHEREPATSLRLIESVASAPSAAVVDVGGGASALVDRLLADGFTDLTVVDVSEHALDEVRKRLGDRAGSVRLVHHDVVTWEPDRQYDVWHDRAVFHFLTDTAARDRYVDIARRAVRDGGVLVIGTFAEDGPAQCSGLPVSRYSATELENTFSDFFSPVARERQEHVTPGGALQPFTWVVLRRA